MSKLYLSMNADNRPEVTRRGHGNITTRAMSWAGVIKTNMWVDYDDKDVIHYEVGLYEHPHKGGQLIKELDRGTLTNK